MGKYWTGLYWSVRLSADILVSSCVYWEFKITITGIQLHLRQFLC